MEYTVWKYELAVVGGQWIEMPCGVKPPSVAVQYGKPCMWCLVEPQAEKVPVLVVTCSTGHSAPRSDLRFVGSYQLENGAFVGHVFVLPEKEMHCD